MELPPISARRLLVLTGALALLGTAGCGDDDSSSATSATAGPTTTSSVPTTIPSTAETSAPSTSAQETTGGTTPGTAVIDPGDAGDYHPDVNASDFVDRVDNPYLPFIPGSKWVYEGNSDGEHERIVIRVTSRHKRVMGIEATVVRDSAYIEGQLAEDTFDWYAQDREGNVWYLGEDTAEYEDGEVVSRKGSWEAGVDGALAGIVMQAHPEVGMAYRQEYYAGEAEDMGEVIAVGGSVEVPAGSFDDVVRTRDWTPIEPDVIEEKSFAPGVGSIREEQVAGGDGVVELVKYRAGE
jgi:hypothetical protein